MAYLHIHSYHRKPTLKTARFIYNVFVARGAAAEVNIPETCRDFLNTEIENNSSTCPSLRIIGKVLREHISYNILMKFSTKSPNASTLFLRAIRMKSTGFPNTPRTDALGDPNILGIPTNLEDTNNLPSRKRSNYRKEDVVEVA